MLTVSLLDEIRRVSRAVSMTALPANHPSCPELVCPALQCPGSRRGCVDSTSLRGSTLQQWSISIKCEIDDGASRCQAAAAATAAPRGFDTMQVLAKTLNRHQRAAVRQNSAIFELVRAIDHILLRKKKS